ncbi:hypothetical protein MA16_Dca020396 [Dendrobium catenatum]|uniref:Uncharacterized protein n=1 Tax=Dendrobium catenatum TaxID=906689 RepID=A0A2I0VVM9_9ASPA|nr:hypothetical protein MA16_Dca020396 [Dendrobium catenatum]
MLTGLFCCLGAASSYPRFTFGWNFKLCRIYCCSGHLCFCSSMFSGNVCDCAQLICRIASISFGSLVGKNSFIFLFVGYVLPKDVSVDLHNFYILNISNHSCWIHFRNWFNFSCQHSFRRFCITWDHFGVSFEPVQAFLDCHAHINTATGSKCFKSVVVWGWIKDLYWNYGSLVKAGGSFFLGASMIARTSGLQRDVGAERRALRWWFGEVLWWFSEVPAVVRRDSCGGLARFLWWSGGGPARMKNIVSCNANVGALELCPTIGDDENVAGIDIIVFNSVDEVIIIGFDLINALKFNCVYGDACRPISKIGCVVAPEMGDVPIALEDAMDGLDTLFPVLVGVMVHIGYSNLNVSISVGEDVETSALVYESLNAINYCMNLIASPISEKDEEVLGDDYVPLGNEEAGGLDGVCCDVRAPNFSHYYFGALS